MFKGTSSWETGPIDTLELSPPHGRNILCMDIHKKDVVTGSADHGLRVYDVENGHQIKQLYTKRYGHTEWVTSTAFLMDGRIVSVGMDGKLCLWENRGIKCTDITGHNGSISKVKVDGNNIGITSGYDTSLLIWDLNQITCEGGLFSGHAKPVTEFEWRNSLVVSGGRDGVVGFWDINYERLVGAKPLHRGSVSKIVFFDDGVDINLVLTAGIEDGVLNVMDMRTLKPVFRKQIHHGAINFLQTNLGCQRSNDQSIICTDIISGFEESFHMTTPTPIFCGCLNDNYAICGCLDGSVLVYDINLSECMFGYGALSEGGVSIMQLNATKNRLVVGGENGQGLVLKF